MELRSCSSLLKLAAWSMRSRGEEKLKSGVIKNARHGRQPGVKCFVLGAFLFYFAKRKGFLWRLQLDALMPEHPEKKKIDFQFPFVTTRDSKLSLLEAPRKRWRVVMQSPKRCDCTTSQKMARIEDSERQLPWFCCHTDETLPSPDKLLPSFAPVFRPSC